MELQLTRSETTVRRVLGERSPRNWDELAAVLLAACAARVEVNDREVNDREVTGDQAAWRTDETAALQAKRLEAQHRLVQTHGYSGIFRGLSAAIGSFETYVRTRTDAPFDFYSDLLGFIWDWALDFEAAEENSPVFLLRPVPVRNALVTETDKNDAAPVAAVASATTAAAADPTSTPSGSDESTPRSNECSRRFIRHVLANAFFMTDSWASLPNFGRISFDAVYANQDVGVERVVCQLSYFYQWMLSVESDENASDRLDENQLVVFQRLRLVDSAYQPSSPRDPLVHWGIACDDCGAKNFRGERYSCAECADYDLCASCAETRQVKVVQQRLSLQRNPHTSEHQFVRMDTAEQQRAMLNMVRRVQTLWPTPDWAQMTQVLDPRKVRIHEKDMETPDSRVFVDFANCMLHIHQIIPSLTQEEVLFSVAPECFLSMLFTETLAADEAVIIRNVRRFSSYTGYLFSFRFSGFYDNPRLREHDIVAIDAVFHSHFERDSCVRDVNKAYLGFAPFAGTRISTGHWGCGAFGGDKAHKFVQQWLAACAADVSLDYSTFNKPEERRALEELIECVVQSKITIAELFDLQCSFREQSSYARQDFWSWLIRSLEHQSTSKGIGRDPFFADPFTG